MKNDRVNISIASIQLSYVRSGYVFLQHGSLWGAGNEAHDWSKLALAQSIHAYLLGMNGQVVGTYNYVDRCNAFPV